MWIGLAVALALWLALSGLGWLDFRAEEGDSSDAGHRDMIAELERELFDQVAQGPGLQGLPGVEHRSRGKGVVVGSVVLHADEGEARPLPGVTIELLGRRRRGAAPRDAQKLHYTTATGVDGTFTLPELPAQGGYVLLVNHMPYRRIVMRGILVSKDQTTDVGALTVGAPTSLAGEVVDAKGRGVRGAVVQVLRDSSRSGSFDLRRALFELDGVLSPMTQGRVGEDGQFLIGDVPPGRYLLRVSAPGYATSFKQDVLVTVDENSSAVRVVLDAGAGFEGTVSDADGNALAGGRVIAVALPGRRVKRFDRIEVGTASDGTYRLDTLIPGVKYGLEVWARGFAPNGRYLEAGAEITKLDWILQRSGRIEGRVVDEESGEGIAECQVTVLSGTITGMSPVSTTTDDAGGFVLPHVNPGPLIMFGAEATGYQSNDEFNFASVRGLRVDSEKTTWIEWKLRAGGSVEGRVTSDAGRPVPYASIALIDRQRGRQQWSGEITAMSDGQGAYQLLGVRPGQYDLRVSAPGYAPPTAGEETHIEMKGALGVVQKNLTLRRGGTVEGTVTTPDGQALGGARVTLRPGNNAASADALRDLMAVSAPNGTFRIHGVPPAMDLLVVAAHDRWVAAEGVRVRVGPGGLRKVSLRLREGAKLPGRVVDRAGQPVEGARIRWGDVTDVATKDLNTSFEADAYLGSRVLRADAAGNFRIEGLAPGTLLLKVEMDGYAAWYRRDKKIGAEGLQPLVHVELESTLTIQGRVVSGVDGRPLARAFVYARERGPSAGEAEDPGRVQAVVSAETDDDGRYVLDRVPPGTHEVVVWFADGHLGGAQAWRNEHVRHKGVAAGARGVDFRLDPVPPPEGEGVR